ncbi:MAG TPA: neutral/alkaline non-lysosomal ceramidase N-terminal domain-containing protein [Candidatus Hydrogenedentes bacterium]|nr:neutral/alkaline non-lysosomal ceramidase N-terminal domain-containing protein [Candidatus Hydrogenedentota bacterium]HPG66090.1 neutral/alkaline non-lysosomal ceramidase N-terminal domain-containing protein [Candidatus Hydrogenedentota bacterium]
MFTKVIVLASLPAIMVGLFAVSLIGPWPTYSSHFEGTRYYEQGLADIAAQARESDITSSPGRLEAGWAAVCINPPKPGVPLAGYGDRRGAPSEGVHDDLHVKALALSDGKDTVVFVGADMLLIPENVAEMVREEVAEKTALTANDLYFAASHTHCSVGGFGPGIAAFVTGGKYDPDIPVFLAHAFAQAIVDAYGKLGPAKLAHGGVMAPEFIDNRTRTAPVDAELSYALVERESGERCYLVSFSAHPTEMSGDTMQFTGSYPGFLQEAIKQSGAEAVYLGGAVGSMRSRTPDGPDVFARSKALGEALAERVLGDAKSATFETNLDIASVGANLTMPPLQIRPLSDRWRLSKFAGPLVGLDTDGWVQAVRIGDILFVGMPGDFSGEISVKWKESANQDGRDLWATSFSADYVGYISPDEYYGEVKDEHGNPAYETGLMSWTGPHQEAFFTAIKDHMLAAITSPGQ